MSVRQAQVAPLHEALQNTRGGGLVPVSSMIIALAATCRIYGDNKGSGFLLSYKLPDNKSRKLVATNHHVLEDKGQANSCEVWFDFDEEGASPTRVKLDSAGYFVTNKELDITLVAIAEGYMSKIDARRAIDLPHKAVEPKGGDQVYIFQHPEGKPKHFSSQCVIAFDEIKAEIRYNADTGPGSSGAAVLNSGGTLVGIHRSGGYSGNSGTYVGSILQWLDREPKPQPDRTPLTPSERMFFDGLKDGRGRYMIDDCGLYVSPREGKDCCQLKKKHGEEGKDFERMVPKIDEKEGTIRFLTKHTHKRNSQYLEGNGPEEKVGKGDYGTTYRVQVEGDKCIFWRMYGGRKLYLNTNRDNLIESYNSLKFTLNTVGYDRP